MYTIPTVMGILTGKTIMALVIIAIIAIISISVAIKISQIVIRLICSIIGIGFTGRSCMVVLLAIAISGIG